VRIGRRILVPWPALARLLGTAAGTDSPQSNGADGQVDAARKETLAHEYRTPSPGPRS
jgi:hypothetical protein